MEAVVAMAVILIVSTAAISCVESFSKSSANLNAKNEAVIVAEDLLEIFKATNNYDQYEDYRLRFIPYFPSGYGNAGYYREDYTISGLTVETILDYTREGKAVFSVSVRDAKRIEILSVKNYEKAVNVTPVEPPVEP